MEVKSLLVNFSINAQNYFMDFLVTFVSVLATAFIGWYVYRRQEREKRIKSDISNFSLLFFAITRNLENAIAILNKANTVLKELNSFVHTMNELEYLADCLHGKKTLSLSIQLPDENAKESYIRSKMDELRASFNLKETYVKIIGSLKEIDFEKEALFLANWGNLKFQSIYKNLESEYRQNNSLIKLINQNIDFEIGSDRQQKNTIFVCDIGSEDYPDKIEHSRQKALFIKNLYEELKESVECIIFYSDLAYKHLIHFNSKFIQKYHRIIADSDIVFSKISLANKIYDLEKSEYYVKYKDIYVLYAELPEYKLLNQNLFEKLQDFRFKSKKH